MKILIVCLGNICRSPIAHGVMQHLVNQEGLNWEIDSAGTGGWHIGQMPDYRSIEVAKKHGINISDQKARKFNALDFQNFDLIYVMDKNNYADVVSLTNDVNERAKVQLFIKDEAVPDPYTDDAMFDPVYQLISTQCEKLLQSLKKENS
jgi:protein-tyrosine phosphatase